MNLKHLTDNTLHQDTLRLVTQERGVTTRILHHLKEIERRKLFSEFKCTSLFDYCVRILGYCESSAQRRIVAARMIIDLPEIEVKIEEGLLSLSNLSQVNQFFRENGIKRVEEKQTIIQKVEGLNKKECEKKLFEISGLKLPAKEGLKRISKDRSKVSLILSDETLAEIEKLKALIGKTVEFDELLKFMAITTIQKVEKEKFKQISNPRERTELKGRRIPQAHVKREVYSRDKKCTKCGSLFKLNFDHRRPYALGGPSSIENIRLLCFNCNQRSRIKEFGTR